jgi:aspartokinase/homoserine dehydrogenase 1
MIVVKFGGTSVGAAAQIDQAARIVHAMREQKPVVVVSAMAGITDALLQAGEAAVSGQTRSRDDKLWDIRSRHDQAVNQLFSDRTIAGNVQESLRVLWEEAQKVFTGVSLLRELSARSRDLISSFGERLMVPVFAQYLTTLGAQAEPVDAREIIITSDDPEYLRVDFEETRKRCRTLTDMA